MLEENGKWDSSCVMVFIVPEIGDLARHLPCGGLRLSGQQEGQVEGEGKRKEGERRRKRKQEFLKMRISLPLGLALGSPIFPSGCEGKLGVALESLQGLRDLT